MLPSACLLETCSTRREGIVSEPQIPGVGHDRRIDLQTEIDKVLATGTLVVSLKALSIGIRDRRLNRDHLLVLDFLVQRLNKRSGTVWHGRQAIADATGLHIRVVENRLYELRTIGHIAGTLLVRSYDRAERVHQAMACRAFAGQFRTLTAARTGVAEVAFLLVLVSGAAGLVVWDRGWWPA